MVLGRRIGTPLGRKHEGEGCDAGLFELARLRIKLCTQFLHNCRRNRCTLDHLSKMS